MDEERAGGAHPETSHHFTLPFSARSLQLGKKPHASLTGKPQGQVYLECFVPPGIGYRPAAAVGGTSPVPPAAGQGTRLDEPFPEHLPAGSWSGRWLLSWCFCSSWSCGILQESPRAPSPSVSSSPGDFISWGDCNPSAPPSSRKKGEGASPQEDHKPPGNTPGQNRHASPLHPEHLRVHGRHQPGCQQPPPSARCQTRLSKAESEPCSVSGRRKRP